MLDVERWLCRCGQRPTLCIDQGPADPGLVSDSAGACPHAPGQPRSSNSIAATPVCNRKGMAVRGCAGEVGLSSGGGPPTWWSTESGPLIQGALLEGEGVLATSPCAPATGVHLRTAVLCFTVLEGAKRMHSPHASDSGPEWALDWATASSGAVGPDRASMHPLQQHYPARTGKNCREGFSDSWRPHLRA